MAGDDEHKGLVGFANFVRSNPLSDKFTTDKFTSVEFWTSDATNAYKRFQCGLGMNLVAKSDQSTGNSTYCSYVLQSNEIVFTFTAPYSSKCVLPDTKTPHPCYNQEEASKFVIAHGFAVRSVGVGCDDATAAYELAVKNGGRGVLEPTTIKDEATGKSMTFCEINLYGDVVVRYESGDFEGPFLPNYEPVESPAPINYGLYAVDHLVGNVPKLMEQINYMMKFSGMHEFAEFTAEDVGTIDSGLNSMVMANNSERILFPINEPTFGTNRKSQIQTFLEQNEGAGLQHIALNTNDIIATLTTMREKSYQGGFEFMPSPSDEYYKNLPAKIGSDVLTDKYEEIKKLGILVDIDNQGILLQIFTKPIGDRPTAFIEIIQRICLKEEKVIAPVAGCGGFGKGNFSELFKSIEDFESECGIN